MLILLSSQSIMLRVVSANIKESLVHPIEEAVFKALISEEVIRSKKQ